MTVVPPKRIESGSYLLADILTIGLVVILSFGLAYFARVGNAPFVEEVPISTSLTALPAYALLSLVRSLIALAISYVFALSYGTIAARNPRYERVMIPMLDVLQSLPVLTFLPGLILALTAVFKDSRWGLELACILMIFTGQVWNLVFAYYESQRGMMSELREFAQIAHLKPAEKFLILDLPNGIRPLIYNGMMSMAGGWFFLTLCEAFTLGDKNYRLPGLGSFLHVAFETGNYPSFLAGIITLIAVIIGVDTVLWKPLIAWTAQFRETTSGAAGEEESSWFLDTLKKTRIQFGISWLFERVANRFKNTDSRSAENVAKDTAIAVATGAPRMRKSGSAVLSTLDIQHFAKIIQPSNWILSSNLPSILRSMAWTQWIVSFSIGGLVFYLLPKLPAIGSAMGTVKSEDWLELIHALLMTALKVGAVLVFSTLWTVPFGLWVGQRPRFKSFFGPIIQNLAAFPAPVLFPVIVLGVHSMGVSASITATLLMTIGNQWYILFNVLSGASRLSNDLKVVSKVYKFSLFTRFRKFYLPGILPSLVTGWVTASGGAWNASIVAEMVDYPGGVLRAQGIGAEITEATIHGNYPRLVAAIIVITIGLVILNRTFWRSLNIFVEKIKA
jgi:NitT/TauT family transport system permease protein